MCTDTNDAPLAADPATCPRHRDLRFGEFLPYARTAFAFPSDGTTSWASLPVQSADGGLLILRPDQWGADVVRDIGDGGLMAAAFRDHSRATPGAGIDLIDTEQNTACIIATENAATSLTTYWDAQCGHTDTWKLFPRTLTLGARGQQSSRLYSLSEGGDVCVGPGGQPGGTYTGLVDYAYLATPFVFTSGKALVTIVERAYSDADAGAATSKEVLYFTREYGVTRWEAWQTPAKCLELYGPVHGPTVCTPTFTAPNCNGNASETDPVTDAGMVRSSCWDLTHARPFDVPYNPLTIAAGQGLVFSKNLLTSGDFARRTMAGWTVPPGGQLQTDLVQHPQLKNWHLDLVTPVGTGAATASSSLFQDVSLQTLRGPATLYFGGLLRAERPSTAAVVLFLFDQTGVVTSRVVSAQLDTGFAHVGGALAWDFTAQPIVTARLQVYPGALGTRYGVDELYLTPTR